MSGLDNPRGLAIGPEGAIYVAEAGRGGTGPCTIAGPGEERCYGPTGAISRLAWGHQRRVLTGLPSHANEALEATGPHDIGFLGWFTAYITIGLGGPPAVREAFGRGGRMFGTLVRVSLFSRPRIVADIVANEAANNPDGRAIDSNPFGLLVRPGSRIVADAGGNALLRVNSDGDISTFAVMPVRPRDPLPFGPFLDSVPTSVVRGRDGVSYIGELTGVPFTAGAARVYRLIPGGQPTVYLTGFKTIIDLAIGPDGRLYVLEHASGPMFFGGPGRVLRVERNGTRTEVVSGLTRPTSLVVDDDGTIYVTNNGVSAGIGEVLKITF